ncbi:hypothetical protein R1flu_005434 [Riccia fluitans]|uniref:Uncharacterized protein n=1 Tax=Riccia fluitans TaxID=41844 RepID=A0ABD1YTZ1_9MARC
MIISSPKNYVEVRVQAEEVPVAERVEEKEKAPLVDELEGVPVTFPIPNKEGPSAAKAEAKPDQRGTKWKQDTQKTPGDRPKLRRKTKVTKKPCETIELSNESQEAKQEEETALPEDSLQLLESHIIEQFCLSLAYGEQIMVPILHIFEGNRIQVEAEVGWRMTFMEIVLRKS